MIASLVSSLALYVRQPSVCKSLFHETSSPHVVIKVIGLCFAGIRRRRGWDLELGDDGHVVRHITASRLEAVAAAGVIHCVTSVLCVVVVRGYGESCLCVALICIQEKVGECELGLYRIDELRGTIWTALRPFFDEFSYYALYSVATSSLTQQRYLNDPSDTLHINNKQQKSVADAYGAPPRNDDVPDESSNYTSYSNRYVVIRPTTRSHDLISALHINGKQRNATADTYGPPGATLFLSSSSCVCWSP